MWHIFVAVVRLLETKLKLIGDIEAFGCGGLGLRSLLTGDKYVQ